MSFPETRLAGTVDPVPGAPTSPPLVQTATFHVDPRAPGAGPDYTRSSNPTRDVLEARLARLEGGPPGATTALSYGSGLAALASVLSLLRPDDGLLLGRDLYGGTRRWVEGWVAPSGVRVRDVDASDPAALAAALADRPRLLLVESPSNPLQEVVDLRAAAAACRRVGARLAVDNTFLTPLLQSPLDLGADLAIQSATKFLGGHGDLTAGVVTVRDPGLAAALSRHRNAAGTALAPFEAWLLHRGLKTLAVRLAAQQRGARRLALWLETRPEVARVIYPGLRSFPGRAVHARQARGPGAVITLDLRDAGTAARLLSGTRLFATAVSFGSVGSSIESPAAMSHASLPPDAPGRERIGDRLVRLSVGLEHPGDLQRDLEAAFDGRDGASP